MGSISAATLRTSAMALCYSTAEYCAPVWDRSPLTKLIDVQLNESMRIVSEALRPTPFPSRSVVASPQPHHSPSHPANGSNKSISQVLNRHSAPDIRHRVPSALHQDAQYGSRNHNRKKCHHDRNGLKSGLLQMQ